MEKIKAAVLVGSIFNKAGTERVVSKLANLLAKSSVYRPVIISINSAANAQAAYQLQPDVTVVHPDLKIDFSAEVVQ